MVPEAQGIDSKANCLKGECRPKQEAGRFTLDLSAVRPPREKVLRQSLISWTKNGAGFGAGDVEARQDRRHGNEAMRWMSFCDCPFDLPLRPRVGTLQKRHTQIAYLFTMPGTRRIANICIGYVPRCTQCICRGGNGRAGFKLLFPRPLRPFPAWPSHRDVFTFNSPT